MKKSNLCFQLVACSMILGFVRAVTLELREGNSTCIKADLSASFSITYNTTNTSTTVKVDLPDSTTVDQGSSSCGSDGRPASLVGVFGPGHTLGLVFSNNGSMYSVNMLIIQYNLSDSALFPLANSSDVVTVMTESVGMWAWLNTTYRCVSPASIPVGGAIVTLSGVKMEAYMTQEDLSPVESVCTADQEGTTSAPTTPSPTTTPVPSPTPQGLPEQGTYAVTKGNETCLMARMGLQLNITYTSQSKNNTVQEVVNIHPNLTTASGTCGASISTLVLDHEGNTIISFTFTLNTTSNKYHLSGLVLVANWSDMSEPVSVSNSNLAYLTSVLGRSYSCNSEQSLIITEAVSINTFRLQVQPFAVISNQFATAVECQIDQDQMLIPIVVGAALSGLVLVVLIAYLIGRKRSNAGYQTI
ncbi:lysosome-associated membrane glycoprotein 1a [Gadus chalcogrammus]|uniref:lysosome-associated membrane glycoprotein 1a n=1 Tax=Gadus chalcogrammus TaxID=1042646 RepID=UPI0024C4C6C6|nr:lysosome-associated membrane glycoprotein 1a [Gadus chalcogrammus]